MKLYHINWEKSSLLLVDKILGAKTQVRTGDPSLFRGMLYQLSYLGVLIKKFLHTLEVFHCLPKVWLEEEVTNNQWDDNNGNFYEPPDNSPSSGPLHLAQDLVVLL